MIIKPKHIINGFGFLLALYLVAFLIMGLMGCGMLQQVERTRSSSSTVQQGDSVRVVRYDSSRQFSSRDSGGFTREIIREYRHDSSYPVYINQPGNILREVIREAGNYDKSQTENTFVNWADSMRSIMVQATDTKDVHVERKPDYLIPIAIFLGLIAFAFITKRK